MFNRDSITQIPIFEQEGGSIVIHWIVRPSEETAAEHLGYERAHLAYRFSDSYLLRGSLSSTVRGGILVLDGLTPCNPERLACELSAECGRLGYHAVMFALHDTPEQELFQSLDAVTKLLVARGIPAIVPLNYAPFCERAVYLVSSAVSGGSLRIYLESLIRIYGAERLALEHPRTCTIFSMPSSSSEGKRITPDALRTWMQEADALSFYSPELCANYCTSNRNGKAEFALFDDARSLSSKLTLGKEFGFPYQFILFSECTDLAQEL